jgi:hypothetical protein
MKSIPSQFKASQKAMKMLGEKYPGREIIQVSIPQQFSLFDPISSVGIMLPAAFLRRHVFRISTRQERC